MKKREVLATLTVLAALGMSACGAKELELTTNQVEVELGSELDTSTTSYVADADVAEEAVIDFSAVDMTKTGTYSATVTYKDQTAGFDVVVIDTTAPEVTIADKVVVAVGEPLYAEDVITSVTELSGEVEVAFSEPKTSADEMVTVEGTEKAEDTEMAEPTEEVESTEAAEETETTETAEETEGAEVEAPEAEFVLNDVICSNAYVIYPETGEYDNTLTVTDASGNSTDVTVHIVVGDAPEIEGVEDVTVTVGTSADEIDFLDGVTAKDSNGNDITANIVCDSAAVNLETAGEYAIAYTVTDENGFTATQTATVTVEEKSGKKSDSKKSDSDKANDSKTDSAKKNDSGSSSSSSNSSNSSNAASNGASGGNGVSSGNSSQTSGDSGNNSNSGNSGNSNQASGGSSASGDSGNSGNTSTSSTPSTDNSGSTSTPSTPAPETPSTPSADTGSSSGGEMEMPDGVEITPWDPDAAAGSKDDELGGSGAYWE